MDDEALRRLEELHERARQAVALARQACDRRVSAARVQRLVGELEAAVREVDGLRVAMQSRAPIEQAKGILMCLHSCSEQAAFAELVRLSQARQTKLRDVAVGLIARVSQRAEGANGSALASLHLAS